MRVVFDTNVVIDAVAARQPFCETAQKLLLMVSEGELTGYLTSNSVTDIFYVVRRALGETETREIIRSLLYSLNVIEVGASDCWAALDLPVDDFEDAIISVCAEKAGADYIVSRDAVFLRSASPVAVISPQELSAKLD
jgi:predicted nucleic acid-binding protein